ncbi:MAG: hypothetical protein JXX28_14555 [Deltaproteobacteria bacterium]|nr:hypothetical protein [Deltaproteobacteria bacterium]
MDAVGSLLPGRALTPAPDGTASLILDASWTVCADPATAALAQQLTSSHLLEQGESVGTEYLNNIDGFPAVGAPVILWDDNAPPAKCQYTSEKVIFLRDWSSLQGFARKPRHSRWGYLTEFTDLQPWTGRLVNDMQSYAISYRADRQQVLIVGGSSQGAQYGTVGFLRDSDHRLRFLFLQGVVPYISWEPRSVLDYPELYLRLSSFPGMNSGDEEGVIDPWESSVVWNRYTHVGNDTQVFAGLALDDPEDGEPGYREVFDRTASFYQARHTRLIPRLYGGQNSMPDPGPLLYQSTWDYVWDPSPLFTPDFSGLRASGLGNGIHLTEGTRVVLRGDAPLVPPEELVPVSWEYLNMARQNTCGFYKTPPPDENWLHQNADQPFDCRTDPDGGITLCSDAGDLCPSVNWNGGQEEADSTALIIYPTTADTMAKEDGDDLPERETYTFQDGHLYALAIRYSLPVGLSAEDYEGQKAFVAYYAGSDLHGKEHASENWPLVPTGSAESYAWATFVFRMPEADLGVSNTADEAKTPQDHIIKIGLELDEDTGQTDTILHLSDIQVFDLGETLAYPVIQDPWLQEAVASCAGLEREGPGCTMAMTGDWGRSYPAGPLVVDTVVSGSPCLVGDTGCVKDSVGSDFGTRTWRQAVLDIPSTELAEVGLTTGGYYHTVLTPGLWPRAETVTDKKDLDGDGDTADEITVEAAFPAELRIGQDFERQAYWEEGTVVTVERLDSNGDPEEDQVLPDGYLGTQLAELHRALMEHPHFFDPSFVDNTQSYTEAKGFNRGMGFDAEPLSSARRLSRLHCRLMQELELMGYGHDYPAGSYSPGTVSGEPLADGRCPTAFSSSILYYGDMFADVHNGSHVYNAPYSGGMLWPLREVPQTPAAGELMTLDPPSALEEDTEEGTPLVFDYRNTSPLDDGSYVRPTFVPWWYRDDPEYLSDYLGFFEQRDFPSILWMGSLIDEDYHGHNFLTDYNQGRGSQREMARLAAANPELVYGAGTYYNAAFASDGELAGAEMRGWEQVTADCMWNPRWRLLRLFEMNDTSLADDVANTCAGNPDIECLDFSVYVKEEDGMYYGYPSSRGGTPDAIRMQSGAEMVLADVPDTQHHTSGPQEYQLRFFVRVEVPPDMVATLEVDVNGAVQSFTGDATEWTLVELEYSLPADTTGLHVSITNLSEGRLLVDGGALHKALPRFELDEDGLPEFPRDIDERSAADGWQYCERPSPWWVEPQGGE